MTDFQTVTYRTNNQVATIGLNRPETLNSFNTQLRLDLLAAIEYANNDEAARVVVITGEGRGFSAGHDLGSGYEGTILAVVMEIMTPSKKRS